jgi:hypothetical protein
MLRALTLGLLLAGIGCRSSTTTAPTPEPSGEKEVAVTPAAKAEPVTVRKGEPGMIQGVVTLDGRPLTGAAVVFSSLDGASEFQRTLEPDGSYEMPTFDPGRYRVTVVPEAPPKDAKGKAEPAKAAAIPERYRHPSTSGLAVEIRGGGHAFDFALTSR